MSLESEINQERSIIHDNTSLFTQGKIVYRSQSIETKNQMLTNKSTFS